MFGRTIKWVKGKVRWFLISAGVVALVLGAEVIPTDMKWAVLYETVAFETVDGDLAFDQYAYDHVTGDYFIRESPKESQNFIIHNPSNPTRARTLTVEEIKAGRTEVAIRCHGCASYAEFVDQVGRRHRVPYSNTDMRTKKYLQERPTLKERRTLIGALVDKTSTASAAYGKVQSKIDVSTAAANQVVIAYTSAVTAGNTLVIGTGYNGSTATRVSSMSGNSNTYTRVTGATEASFVAGEVWYAYNVNSGTTTLTINYTHTMDIGVALVEYNGLLSATTPLDVSTSTSCATGCANPFSSGNTATTTQNEELVFGFAHANSGVNVMAVGTGFSNYEEGVNGTTGIEVAIEDKRQTATAVQAALFAIPNGEVNRIAAVATFKEVTAFTEQEGFAFGDDDGSEAVHTLGGQDSSITGPLGTKTLRVLVNATSGDPAAIAYALRYQKNGAGGYGLVPTSSLAYTTPTPTASNATNSGSDTASTTWSVSVPAASSSDLLIFGISWDDSTNVTAVTPPSGQNGETLTAINGTPATDSGTETRSQVWYVVTTGNWTAGTLVFTPNAAEQWTASVVRVPAGQFDSGTPIGASVTRGSTSTTATSIQNSAFTASSTDGNGRMFVWTSADADPQTVAAGFTAVSNVDRGNVSGGMFTRDSIVTNSESIASTTVATIASDSWTTVAFVVRAATSSNQVYVSLSGNVAASGETTTARLAPPSGKATSTHFTAGRRWDDENGSDSIDVGSGNYTELEWVLTTQTPATTNDYYDFRVYEGAGVMSEYTTTPRWTIGTASTAPPQRRQTIIISTLIPTLWWVSKSGRRDKKVL